MDEKLYPTGSNALATNTDRASAFCMTPYPSTWNSLGSTPAYVLKKKKGEKGERRIEKKRKTEKRKREKANRERDKLAKTV